METETRKKSLHTSRLKIRYYDTDLSKAVFFTNHIKYFDSIAILDFLEGKGVHWEDLLQDDQDVAVASASFDYKSPLFLNDLVDITVDEVVLGRKSIQFRGSIYKVGSGDLVGRGKVVYVFVNFKTRQSIPIPAAIREKLSDSTT